MMNKILLLGAAATLALAGCSSERGYSERGTPTPQSQLIEPSVANGNGCNFEDSGANCKRPDVTKSEIQSDSGK